MPPMAVIPGPRPPAPASPPRLPSPPAPAPPRRDAALAVSLPNPNVLLTRKLVVTEPGPLPKLRGMISPVANGSRSKAPQRVTITVDFVRSVANLGRSVNKVSPLRSVLPRVILNGRPEVTITKGFRLTPQGMRNEPVITKRCLISWEARPYSPLKSYGFAG